MLFDPETSLRVIQRLLSEMTCILVIKLMKNAVRQQFLLRC